MLITSVGFAFPFAPLVVVISGSFFVIRGFLLIRDGDQESGAARVLFGAFLLVVGSIVHLVRYRRRARAPRPMSAVGGELETEPQERPRPRRAPAAAIRPPSSSAPSSSGPEASEHGRGARDDRPEAPAFDPAAFIASIPALRDVFLRTTESVTGSVPSDDDVGCFERVDELVDTLWEGNPPILLDETVTTFGAFVGEAMRKHLGGEWAWEEEIGVGLTRFPGRPALFTFPFNRVRRRLEQGPRESIAAYFEMTRRLVETGADGGA